MPTSMLKTPGIFENVSMHCTHGALQVFGMTCRMGFEKAYCSDRWACIDMSSWPFALKEVRQARKNAMEQAEYEIKHRAYLQEKDLYDRTHPHFEGRGMVTMQDIMDMPVEPMTPTAMRTMWGGFDMIGADLFADAPPIFANNRLHTRNDTVDDQDMDYALRHIPSGVLKKLIVCSSRITDSGLLTAVSRHGPCLESLAVGCAGSEHLVGTFLDNLSLRHLEIYNAPKLNIKSLNSDLLQKLCISGVSAAMIDLIPRFTELQVLKLSAGRDGECAETCFHRIFSACTKLRKIDIYNVVKVNCSLAACIQRHVLDLESVVGFTNDRRTNDMLKASYPAAVIWLDHIDHSAGW